jgi:hypothetical protein
VKNFATWYDGLAEQQKTSFARRAKTTRNYIESHLLAPYKIPRAEAMNNLAAASGEFTVAELAAWFYETSLARKHREPPRDRAA